MIFQTKSKFQIILYEALRRAFKTNFTAAKSQKCYHGSPCSSVRARWRALLPVQSTNGVCGKACSTEFQAGRDVLRAVHLSQPIIWALLWTTAVNNFFQDPKSLSFSFFSLHYLYRTNHQVLVTISTLAVEKAKRWNIVVVSLCLTEESLQNWAQNLTLKEELMWAVRQRESQCGRLWKGLWVDVSLSNCKPAHTSVWTLIMHLSKHGCLWFLLYCGSAVLAVCFKVCLHSDRPFTIRVWEYNCSNYSEIGGVQLEKQQNERI